MTLGVHVENRLDVGLYLSIIICCNICHYQLREQLLQYRHGIEPPVFVDRATSIHSFRKNYHTDEDGPVVYQCEDNSVSEDNLKPHYVRQMEPRHRLGEIVRRSSCAATLLALCPNTNTNNKDSNFG